MARFDATSYKITVIHAYAPRTASSDENLQAFYDISEDTLAKIHKKDSIIIIIITSEWNGKIGSADTDWRSVMGRDA